MLKKLNPIKKLIFILSIIILMCNVFISYSTDTKVTTSVIAILMIIIVFLPEKKQSKE